MAEPGRLMGQTASDEVDHNDVDGEYEVDDEGYDQATGQNSVNGDGNLTDAEGSDVDAEGEEVDDEDEGEPVGAVKMAAPRHRFSDQGHHDRDDGDAAADSFSDAKTSESEHSDASGSESEVENEWQAESEDGEGPGSGRTESNDCT
jgi:histone acetyltransferase SAS3